MHLRHVLAVLAGAIVVLAAACGGDDDNDDGQLDDALARFGPNDLALLVLSADDLDGLADGFEIADDSGERDNASFAEDSLDPEDTGDILADAGRISGYSLSYDNPTFFEALQAGEGLLSVGTSAELWTDADAARKGIDKRLRDFQQFKGTVIDDVELVDVTELDIEDIGEQSGGLHYIARLDDGAFDITIYSTLVYVRVGRVVLTANAVSADDRGTQPALESIARRLEARLRAVALGEITITPVPIDNGSPDSTPATPGARPPGVPDLERAALRVHDLPPGFVVVDEGYAAPPDAQFTRDFEVDSSDQAIAVGATRVINIQNEVSLFESTAEASAFVGAVEAILSGQSGADLFRSIIEDQGGIAADDVELDSFPIDMGDQAVAIVGTLDAGIARFGMAFLIVRVDGAVGSLIITGFADGFSVDDLSPLLETVATRLESIDR